MAENIVLMVILLMLGLILFLFFLACKPWRFLFSTKKRIIKADDDIEKPLFSDDLDLVRGKRNDVAASCDVDESNLQIERNVRQPRTDGLLYKQGLLSTDVHASQGSSLVLDVISDPSEDLLVGQTLKRTLVSNWPVEERKHFRKEELNNDLDFICGDGACRVYVPKDVSERRSSLTLEVISGPSCGLRCTLNSTNTSRLPLKLGRVSPSDLLVEDSEVSGKHAQINWNLNKLKWELVDMGSLNGTLLNSQSVHHPDSGHRQWSDPVELSNGDIITLGTVSKVIVQITPHTELQIPFGVGVASDPMSLRRGGKKLSMEDVCYHEWPLPGVERFGLFGIFDGHGGAGAAKFASKMLPRTVANILSISERRERVLSLCDASDVLWDAFSQTEAAMNHQYEGCTATVILVWAAHHHEEFFLQCANVGDSSCVINMGGKLINMTQDHKVVSQSERIRLKEIREPLKDGETRLSGLNLARMLGDKFLKEQDARFSSEPYVSQAVHITKASKAFALLASDGLWDVISTKKAMQLALQTRDRYSLEKGDSAERIANFMLSEARTLRTKDNTTIILLDFDTNRTAAASSCNIDL